MGLILVKSDLRLLFFVFCPREACLVLLKILLIPFFLYYWLFQSLILQLFPFFMSDLLFFFIKLDILPSSILCVTLYHVTHHFLGLVFFIARSSERPEGSGHEGEWQGTRIIMSLLMCHAGSSLGS